MMHHRRIGTADVFGLTEIIGPTHDPAMLYPDLPRAEFEALAPRLTGAHYAPGTIGRRAALMSLERCVRCAEAGRVTP